MAYEPRELSGSLFKNDKATSDKQPGYKGSCKIAGVDYWISGWVKEANGKRFFSFAFKPKTQGGEVQKDYEQTNTNDDIPF